MMAGLLKLPVKKRDMKILWLVLLFAVPLVAQQKVYNIQEYCIDKAPFKNGKCDQRGNDYSWVFIDENKKEVSLFLSQTKLQYAITYMGQHATERDFILYTLTNAEGSIDMKINKGGDKIVFIYPNYRIFLKAGKSTKSGT
jgi:hypothetical protein